MKPPNIEKPDDPAAAMCAPEFQIMILAECDQLLVRAMQVCEYLMVEFGPSFVYRIAMSTFASLEEPNHYEQALRAGQSADMLFVVSDIPLPDHPMQWLRDCLRLHQGAYAVADMTRPGTLDYQALTKKTGAAPASSDVEVFHHHPRWLRPVVPALPASPAAQEGCRDRWGLNE